MIDLGQIRDIDTLKSVFVGTCSGDSTSMDIVWRYEQPKFVTHGDQEHGYEYDALDRAIAILTFTDDFNPETEVFWLNVDNSSILCDFFYRGNTVETGSIKAGDTCMFLMEGSSLFYLIAVDRWGADIPTKTSDLTNDSGFLTQHQDISNKQDALVSGTNIKTVDGNSLLGSGDLSLSGKIFQGVTYSASSETTKVVTINTPANTTFKDGDLLFLRFYNDVAASVTGTIVSIGSKTYGIAYRNYGLQAAGVIKAGDNVLLHCFGGYAIIISIDRWGADIASLLPKPTAADAGKLLAVSSAGAYELTTIVNSEQIAY